MNPEADQLFRRDVFIAEGVNVFDVAGRHIMDGEGDEL